MSVFAEYCYWAKERTCCEFQETKLRPDKPEVRARSLWVWLLSRLVANGNTKMPHDTHLYFKGYEQRKFGERLLLK